MNCDSSCLGWVEASTAIFDRLGAKPFDVVAISLAGSSGDYDELPTTVVQLVPRQCQKRNGDTALSLHHVLYDYLMQSLEVGGLNFDHTDANDSISIAPILPYPGMMCSDISERELSPCCWRVDRINVDVSVANLRLQVQCLYADADVCDSICDEELEFVVSSALQGRWIMAGSTVVLSIESDENMLIVVICSVNGSKDKVAYRLGTTETYEVKLSSKALNMLTDEVVDETDGESISCLGYEALMASIIQLLSIHGASSPSGLFLLGCSGVGKTRLLKSIRDKLRSEQNVYYVSLQEMLLEAGCSTEESLMRAMLPHKYSKETVWIVDDLDVLHIDGTADDFSSMDHERRLLLNCLLLAIDRLVEVNCKVIGAGQNITTLPVSIVKAGRLEKVLEMLPPTQRQREAILCSFLQLAGYDEVTCQRWSELLASATAGCVAGDIHRLAADACEDAMHNANTMPSWKNWKDASRACLPSQLAALDVIKPALHFDGESTLDWLSAHEESWSMFRGYASLKKRVFRTVVAPWRRHLTNPLPLSLESAAIAPPSGVLFHGPSGCGKTMAATCLGSALGLPMIKVRAPDILDKWLGGSEEAIRSLFVRARAAAPCILLFDEIDSIANNRATSGESTDVMSRLLSTLLNEMDGVSSGRKDNVLVVACTNRLDSLDAALLRPGRLEEHIELSLPTKDDALDILEHKFSRISTESDVDLSAIATELVKWKVSAADLDGIVRESVYRCLRRYTGAEDVTVKEVDVMEATNVLKI